MSVRYGNPDQGYYGDDPEGDWSAEAEVEKARQEKVRAERLAIGGQACEAKYVKAADGVGVLRGILFVALSAMVCLLAYTQLPKMLELIAAATKPQVTTAAESDPAYDQFLEEQSRKVRESPGYVETRNGKVVIRNGKVVDDPNYDQWPAGLVGADEIPEAKSDPTPVISIAAGIYDEGNSDLFVCRDVVNAGAVGMGLATDSPTVNRVSKIKLVFDSVGEARRFYQEGSCMAFKMTHDDWRPQGQIEEILGNNLTFHNNSQNGVYYNNGSCVRVQLVPSSVDGKEVTLGLSGLMPDEMYLVQFSPLSSEYYLIEKR